MLVPEPLEPALARVRANLLDRERLVRAVAAGRRRGGSPRWRRADLRWVELRGAWSLQVVTYDERQAYTRNVDAAAAPGAVDALLEEPYGNWHVDTHGRTLQLRVTKRGDAQVHEAPATSAPPRSEPFPAVPAVQGSGTHDRVKPHLLAPDDPLFTAVGAGADKRRQVDAFLRMLQPVAHRLAGGPLRVADLGCGNAYLSFAAFRLLHAEVGRDVELVGVDLRPAARQRNAELARQLGWGDHVRFVADDISTVELRPPPQLVLALHACDTATDAALARAVRWQSPVVIAAPCCHHDLQVQLRTTAAPAPYALLTRHATLRERFADTLTDALRAALLRLAGYRVDVVEFVASRHTPRNVALRAVHTGGPPDPAIAAGYRELRAAWGVRPALEDLLGDSVAALVGSPAGQR